MVYIARLKKLIFLLVVGACGMQLSGVCAAAMPHTTEPSIEQGGAARSGTVRYVTQQPMFDLTQVALLENAPAPKRAGSPPGYQIEFLRPDFFGNRELQQAADPQVYGLHLPEPGTGSAVLATMALIAFVFVRRSAR